MRLEPGTTLGPYQIIEQAGAGGMGEVYRAKDNRLDRTVAIKVLPDNVAANPDLKQRFEREAKVISGLNHPNICTLYDIGSDNGTDYLVMEYLEGETLSEKLKTGPMATDEVLKVASQIADALDNAHRKGLVHRDLKPGNVILTKEGAKLLDFGLAKIQIGQGEMHHSAITQTTPLTGTGTLLGTLNYMAPEQLEGEEADARSDIFAFGVMVYEMATGRKAFEGKSQASMIAGILEREPAPISSLNAMAPPGLDRLVKKCMQKDPDRRWQSVRDMSDEIKWISQGGSLAGVPANLSVKRRLRSRLAWSLVVVASIIAIIFAVLWFTQPIPAKPTSRFIVRTQTNLSNVNWPCISPDGRQLAFLATNETGQEQIWICPLNSLDAYPLAGTEGAGRPFWSPDSRHLAYFANRSQLKKIAVAGGPAQLIGEADGGADGTWGAAGMIVFDGSVGDSLRMIPATGGSTTAVSAINREAGETFHAWPWFLPDGEHFLYLAGLEQNSNADSPYNLKVGSLSSKESIDLFPVDTRVEYSKSGYIVFVRDGILLAHKFEADKLELSGEPIPIAEKIALGGGLDLAHFGISNEGTLVYQSDVNAGLGEIVWVDRQGKVIERVGEPGQYDAIALSPDEKRLAYSMWDEGQRNMDLWVRDLERGVSSRLTFEPSRDIWPCWSPDSREVYYASDSAGVFRLLKKVASGTGISEIVFRSDSGNIGPIDYSAAAGFITCGEGTGDRNLVAIDPVAKTRKILYATPYTEDKGMISPNGHYMAFENFESGRYEVYVLDLQGTGGKWQVSSNGGRRPKWRGDGKELYYVDLDWKFMAVPVVTEGKFEIGNPTELFTSRLSTTGFGQKRYNVTADGQRFLLQRPLSTSGGGEFVTVLNWDQAIKGE